MIHVLASVSEVGGSFIGEINTEVCVSYVTPGGTQLSLIIVLKTDR